MARRRDRKKVVKMKRRPRLFTGTLLIIFAVYLFVIFIQSLTKERVSIYEVTEKQLADDDTNRGIILRDEMLITTKKAGYINYYVGEGARVGCTTTVYSLDSTGEFMDELNMDDTEDISLSEDDTREIRSDIANYRNSFSLSDYNKVTNFKYNIDNTLLQMTTVNLLNQINKMINTSGSMASLKMVKAKKSGIISFCSDGLEDLKISTLSAENFENMNDDWEKLRSAGSVSAGNPVYKLIRSEDWSVVVPLNNEQYEKIYDKESIPVTFKKDGHKMNASVSTFTIDGTYYAELSFSKYMVRYIDNRYVDVELEFDDADGLKIPTSSILEKDFYVVPKTYITEGGSNGGTGVMLLSYAKDGTEEYIFKDADIYYEDEKGNCYIDSNLFEIGSTIVKGTSSGTTSMQLAKTNTLEGVYNCNQGYCVFRRIEKLFSNSEYTIVSKDTKYGLSTYDHIILNPDTINENDII